MNIADLQKRIEELEAENTALKSALNSFNDEMTAIFEHSSMGIALVDDKRTILKANKQFLSLLGYESSSELLGKNTRAVHVSDSVFNEIGGHYNKSLLINGIVRVTSRLKQKDGTEIWLDLVGKTVDNSTTPDLSRGVLWMAYDLTAIRSIYNDLSISNNELENYFNNSMVGVLVLRGGRKIYRINSRLAEMLGDEPPEFHKGRLISDYYPSEEEYEEFGRKYYNNLINQSQLQVELQVKKLDGTLFCAVASGKSLDNSTPPDLNKGVIWMIDDITEKKEAEEKLEKLATTDFLTGISNRRHFIELAEREISAFNRHKRPLSILQMDIDYFKNINDSYGHATGDAALRHFTSTCVSLLRTEDIIGRIGGEEFCILLPDTDKAQAEAVAERICSAVRKISTNTEHELPNITVSIGIAEAKEQESLDELLQKADKALYMAKDKGRDRIETSL